MRVVRLLCSILLTGSCFLPAAAIPTNEEFRDTRSRLSLETVDFTLLEEEARKWNPELSSPNLENLVRSNFQFIFLNNLNEARFLSSPKPELVVKRILSVLQLSNQLGQLLWEGRRIAARRGSDAEKRKWVLQVAKLAEDLNESFTTYFVQLQGASYTVNFRMLSANSSQFVHYLSIFDRIDRLVNRELTSYFFNAKPGVVEVADYERFSVAVLTQTLKKLSRIMEKKLRR